MDFAQLKQKAVLFWNKVKEATNKAIEKWAETLQTTSFVIKDIAGFEEVINASANKTWTNGVVYQKKSLVLVGNPESDFFKKALYILPVVYTKAWTQNTIVKLLSSKTPDIDFTKYGLDVTKIPACIVFWDKKVYKIIAWEENINKLVTSLSLDIISTIETL